VTAKVHLHTVKDLVARFIRLDNFGRSAKIGETEALVTIQQGLTASAEAQIQSGNPQGPIHEE
jgi:hypothetical protein